MSWSWKTDRQCLATVWVEAELKVPRCTKLKSMFSVSAFSSQHSTPQCDPRDSRRMRASIFDLDKTTLKRTRGVTVGGEYLGVL